METVEVKIELSTGKMDEQQEEIHEKHTLEFLAEERISDSFKIDRKAVQLAGGYNELAELKVLISKYWGEYQAKVKETLGEPLFTEKNAIITNTKESNQTRFKVLQEFVEAAENEYSSYYEVKTTLDKIFMYARAIVLQVPTKGVPNIEELPAEVAMQVLEKLEENKVFFRTPERRDTQTT